MQKALLQSDVHSKSDKSPVTVADYGLFFNSTVRTLSIIRDELVFFRNFVAHYAIWELQLDLFCDCLLALQSRFTGHCQLCLGEGASYRVVFASC